MIKQSKKEPDGWTLRVKEQRAAHREKFKFLQEEEKEEDKE